MSDLKKAIDIAEEAHKNVKDKGGNDYIEHPKRIMSAATTETRKIVAILHDVVEDTSWQLEDLEKEGFSNDVISGVDGMTRRKDESYMNFIKRLSHNPDCVEIKMLDIKDNTDINRIPAGNEEWFYKNRNGKYKKAYNFLKPIYEDNKNRKKLNIK